MIQNKEYNIWDLMKDSLNPKSIVSSKRVILLFSQWLFAFQIFIDIITHTTLLLFIRPLPSVEFYTVMAGVQALGLLSNLAIMLWSIGAIRAQDIQELISIYKVEQQKQVTPGEAIVADGDQTIIDVDEMSADNVENVTTENLNTKKS